MTVDMIIELLNYKKLERTATATTTALHTFDTGLTGLKHTCHQITKTPYSFTNSKNNRDQTQNTNVSAKLAIQILNRTVSLIMNNSTLTLR